MHKNLCTLIKEKGGLRHMQQSPSSTLKRYSLPTVCDHYYIITPINIKNIVEMSRNNLSKIYFQFLTINKLFIC